MKLNRSSMLYGTLVLTLTSIISQVLGFVYRIFLSRLIGAEVMGLYQLIMPVYSVIMSLTAIGLTVACPTCRRNTTPWATQRPLSSCSGKPLPPF